ncbi:MAG TPA: hypothetical protein VFQ60_01465 [Patescibacteria group bacterium]|nr:hypothetical protein [Patescibacteria group bacterium]
MREFKAILITVVLGFIGCAAPRVVVKEPHFVGAGESCRALERDWGNKKVPALHTPEREAYDEAFYRCQTDLLIESSQNLVRANQVLQNACARGNTCR